MAHPDTRIERARQRQKIASEVINICRRLTRHARRTNDPEQTDAALQLHDAHARHSRERGEIERAEQAEKRYVRARDHQIKRQ